MSPVDPDDMPAAERADRLGSGGVGVLSFGTDTAEAPHAVPVSYGFDAVDEVFYFRLAIGPESAKGTVENRPATFVTYGSEDGEWWSVVAQGKLVSTDEASVSTASLEGLDRVQIPIVDAFDAPLDEVSFSFVRLDPAALTGLASG